MEPTLETVVRGSDSIALHVYPAPDSAPALAVLWPAMGVPARYYRTFAAELTAAGMAVVVVDLRGTGASSPPPGRGSRYGLGDLTADVDAVLSHLKPHRAGRRTVLVGHSLGGQACALHLASTAASPAAAAPTSTAAISPAAPAPTSTAAAPPAAPAPTSTAAAPPAAPAPTSTAAASTAATSTAPAAAAPTSTAAPAAASPSTASVSAAAAPTSTAATPTAATSTAATSTAATPTAVSVSAAAAPTAAAETSAATSTASASTAAVPISTAATSTAAPTSPSSPAAGASPAAAAAAAAAGREGGSDVDGLVLIAVGLPYWRSYPRGHRLPVLLQTQALGLASAALRVWPGWGFGGRQARGVIRDWAFTARAGRYPRLGGVDVEAAFARVRTPVFAVDVAGDRYTPPGTVSRLLDKFSGAAVTRERYAPEAAVDHFRWAKHGGELAGRVAVWVQSL